MFYVLHVNKKLVQNHEMNIWSLITERHCRDKRANDRFNFFWFGLMILSKEISGCHLKKTIWLCNTSISVYTHVHRSFQANCPPVSPWLAHRLITPKDTLYAGHGLGLQPLFTPRLGGSTGGMCLPGLMWETPFPCRCSNRDIFPSKAVVAWSLTGRPRIGHRAVAEVVPLFKLAGWRAELLASVLNQPNPPAPDCLSLRFSKAEDLFNSEISVGKWITSPSITKQQQHLY